MKHKLIMISIVTVVIIGCCVFGIAYAVQSNKKADAIPVGSPFAVAQQHSQGKRPACLTKDATAEKAVRKDDYLINGTSSAFDLATTMGIIDVPAGTNVDEYIHSYDDNTVTGSISYPPKYGDYNFTIVPSSKSAPYHQWTMTSLIACQK